LEKGVVGDRGGIKCWNRQIVPKRRKKPIKEGSSMISGRFAEIEEEPRRAMAFCSAAMVDAIKFYGFKATLDFVVRVSNCDAIVRELLPFFPSLANATMWEISNKRRSLKVDQGITENCTPQSES
jgi:putative component of membrane protein insertase Oxa1/YidC/SpoIIIJ protein YidD